MTEDKKDPNCWVCHKEGSTIFCPKCFLGFHVGCAVRTKEEINRSDRNIDKMCHQCLRIEESRHLYTSSQKFKSVSKEMLNSIFDVILLCGKRIEPTPQIMETKRDRGMFKKVKHFINFSTVKSKIENNEYGCTEELLFDLRKIEHVMLIEFKEGHQIEDLDLYIKQLSRHCQEIDLCPHCIYNHYLTSSGPALTCPWGHRLATVCQSKNYTASFDIFNMRRTPDLPRYFPVKVISYSQCLSQVHVRLFDPGKPWSLKVPITNVNHLSNCDLEQFYGPTRDIDLRFQTQTFNMALKELRLHLEELKKKFGNRSSLPSKSHPWRSSDHLFINHGLKVGVQQKIRFQLNRLGNSKLEKKKEDKCGKDQGLKAIEQTKDSNNNNRNKRSSELNPDNSSKKPAREKTMNDLETCSTDASSEALPSGWSSKVAPHGRTYFINDSDGTVSWIDPRTKKPCPPLTCSTFDLPNGGSTTLLNGWNKKDQDPRLSRPGRNEPFSSLNASDRTVSGAKSADWLPCHENSAKSVHHPEISAKSGSLEKADVNVKTLSNDSTVSILLRDDIGQSLPPTPSDHNRSDEESTLLSAVNHSESRLRGNESDKIISLQEGIVVDNSSNGISNCQLYSEKFFDPKTQGKKSRASSDVLCTSKEKSLRSIHEKKSVMESGRKFEKLESESSEGRSLSLDGPDCEKHGNDSQASKSSVESHLQELLTEECSRCNLLEDELDKRDQLINYYEVHCKALVKFCSDLRGKLKKTSI
ncbi:uncharacterized protein LOC141851834 isoform X2 [Brevipalpus obovatus]|uniref:uncharacterized protein LOC141851834 isoform X2 n=1 Tax=Brevipalpus obovatus TaxID=246614 RepID=UPI003D9F0F91